MREKLGELELHFTKFYKILTRGVPRHGKPLLKRSHKNDHGFAKDLEKSVENEGFLSSQIHGVLRDEIKWVLPYYVLPKLNREITQRNPQEQVQNNSKKRAQKADSGQSDGRGARTQQE
jgi:hypothetical protein